MNRTWLLAIGVALWCCGLGALADAPKDDDAAEAKHDGVEIVVDAIDAILVDKNMVQAEIDIDIEESVAESLKDLPKAVRLQIEKAMDGKQKAGVFSSVFFVDPTGKLEKVDAQIQDADFLKGLPKHVAQQVREAMAEAKHIQVKKVADDTAVEMNVLGNSGRVVLWGTDGNKREIHIVKDDSDAVMREIMRFEERATPSKKRRQKRAADQSEELEKKLDLILERLEHLEKEIHSLKQER